MNMESKTVKYFRTDENDYPLVDIEGVSCLSPIKKVQSEVSDPKDTAEETRHSIEQIYIKTERNTLNEYIKTEQASEDEIYTQIGHQTRIEEICIKKEEVDIKQETLTSQSTLKNTDVSEGRADPLQDASNSICEPTTAIFICKSCRKVIKQGPKSVGPSRNEAEAFKCEDCRETATYKCSICPYQTHRRNNLTRHTLSHKDRSEVKMLKCTQCEYETKYLSSLRSHVLKHRDASETEAFHCDFCTFKSKYKKSLKTHMLSHKDPSEVKKFSCNMCDFSTKYKNYIGVHILCHKNRLEVETFSCETCKFSTKYKEHLKRHLLIHKQPSEVEIFKCEMCTFTTKYKRCLKRHKLRYKH